MAVNKSEGIILTGGVKFSDSYETLKFYDEGVWTPVVEGDSTAGSYSYSTQSGLYTRIGRELFIEATLEGITQVSAGSGDLKITGLSSLGFSYKTGDVHIGQMVSDTLNYGSFYGWGGAHLVGNDIYLVLSKTNAASVNVAMSMLVSGSTNLWVTIHAILN